MADWQRKLKIGDVWQKPDKGEMSIQELAKVIADRLGELKPFGLPHIDDKRDEIQADFLVVSKDPSADADDFDCVFAELYDWGDMPLDSIWNGKKVCWIDTFEKAEASHASPES